MSDQDAILQQAADLADGWRFDKKYMLIGLRLTMPSDQTGQRDV